jgi:hypothetical protein
LMTAEFSGGEATPSAQTSHQIQVLIVAAVAIIQLSGYPMATENLRCQWDHARIRNQPTKT